MPATQRKLISISIATAENRKIIYSIRHDVYARELQQHHKNDEGVLSDELDRWNHYIVARIGNDVAGFISITPPEAGKYSIDKYFPREATGLSYAPALYEVRLLTVRDSYRHSPLALLLMYAAFRWVQAHGGRQIVAICRANLLDLYHKAGMQLSGHRTVSGKVTYELATASVDRLQQKAADFRTSLEKINGEISWQLPFGFFSPAQCYHGGSFFEAIGEDLQTISNASNVINADVLDAWFPPSPRVIAALQENIPWLLQTSPPTHATGLEDAIAKARGVNKTSVLAGAGSSDLIFLALQNLLNKNSRVLVVDPCYGEYLHVLQHIIHCHVQRFSLHREEGFCLNADELVGEIGNGYDMVILVNPNSPTGVYTEKEKLISVLRKVPASTLVRIDETYVEYIGASVSLETFAAASENIVVCKSMSKVYALSGARAAYLCAPPHLLEMLRSLSPPWSVSLPAQLAAIEALKDSAYYEEMYSQTHELRKQLFDDLKSLGITDIIPGCANFLLFFLPENISAEAFVSRCREKQLYLRTVENMSRSLTNGVRIAVKDELSNRRMLKIISETMESMSCRGLKADFDTRVHSV
ncbi:MAG: aminotransferase class I/II-fold pyridoxal phosphate-dependent enzyme [Flavisolibacter sp.]